MLNAFESFCKEKGLIINVDKTKAMQINMNAQFQSGGVPIKNVAEFKYLGLMINRANNNPNAMLEHRICKARAAFNCI